MSTSWVRPSTLLKYGLFFKKISAHTRLPVWEASEEPVSNGITDMCQCIQLYVAIVVLTSGPHACVASTLSTEPSWL